MATIAPWLKGPDVLDSMTRGAAAGTALRNIQLQAYANALRHNAAMASAAASRANANQRASIARQQMEQRRKEAAQDLLAQKEALQQRGDLAQMKAAQELEMANRPRFMNVSGGLARIQGGGEPTFIQSPFGGSNVADELQALFEGSPPQAQQQGAAPNAPPKPPMVTNQNPNNRMYASELGPSFVPDWATNWQGAQGTSGLTKKKR